MSDRGYDADVIVIGGGPAGSTAAALLAGAGRRVLLFEKDRFPRFAIGESLLPYNVELLRRLGVADSLEGLSVPKYGAQMMSSDATLTTYIDFSESLTPDCSLAYHVLRSRFDDLLLRNAARLGADVREGRTVVEATASHRDGCILTTRDAEGATTRHRARFLLDASGRGAFLASRAGRRHMMRGLRKAAVYAHYDGVVRDEGRHAGDIILIVLKDGWFWFIPLPDGVTSVGLVMDAAAFRSGSLKPEELLQRAIACCPAARARMRDARPTGPVRTASDYSYDCGNVVGDGYLLVGDAAGFIDPIFSSGVWLAMSSGEMAADAVDRALGGPGRRADLSPAAFAGYARSVRRHLRAYTGIVRRFYTPGFMDVFLRPTSSFRLKEAVTSLLAGQSDPPPRTRVRIWCFYLVLAIHRRLRLAPAVPLRRVLEEDQV